MVVLTFAETEDILGLALQGLARGLPAVVYKRRLRLRRGYALPWIRDGQAESAGLAVAFERAQAISVAKYA